MANFSDKRPRAVAPAIAVLLLAVAAAIGSRVISVADSGPKRVVLGDLVLNIPSAYLVSVPSSLSNLKGMDDGSRDALLYIPAKDMATHIAGFKLRPELPSDEMSVLVYKLNDVEIERYRDQASLAVRLDRVLEYSALSVKPDVERNITRVHAATSFGWDVVAGIMTTEEEVRAADFSAWLGSCYEMEGTVEKGGVSTMCSSYVVDRDVALEFHTNEQKIILAKEIRAHLLRLIAEWRKP